jgi:CheY-like chemotaxis protein
MCLLSFVGHLTEEAIPCGPACNLSLMGNPTLQPRILIVDDNPAVRNALRHLLEGGGSWDVSEAVDGKTGIARALELRPHVIVLDLVMPVMDGLNAAREISRALPDAAILMYTMHWSPALEVEAHKNGVSKLISKSQGNVLLSTVQELIAALPSEEVPPTPEPTVPMVSPAEPSLAAKPEQSSAAPSGDPPLPPDSKLAS